MKHGDFSPFKFVPSCGKRDHGGVNLKLSWKETGGNICKQRQWELEYASGFSSTKTMWPVETLKAVTKRIQTAWR